VSQASLRWIGALPKPVLVISYLATFVLWLALTASTLQLWQQQVVNYSLMGTAQSTVRGATGTMAADEAGNGSSTATRISADGAHPKTGRIVAAWLPTSFDVDQARASFDANKDVLDEVSPFWYEARSDGTLQPELGARDRELVDAAHAANVLVIPTIHNVNDVDAVVPVLADTDLRASHIDAIVNEVETYNYDGIDIDYEVLPDSSRDAFSAFVGELAAALHNEGKLLTIAVHAKDSDDDGLGAFQDLKQIGAAADRVRIMTYDYHWRGGDAGPVAPIHWVASVAEYVRSVVPASKIELGIPFYGYNWGEGGEATPQTWVDIQALINRYQPRVNVMARNEQGTVEESWFSYEAGGETRTVWFSDRRAMDAKLALVEQQDLAGIAIWRLGSEDLENWQVIRERLGNHSSVTQRTFNTYLPEH
jgi:spore germination protein YaaH